MISINISGSQEKKRKIRRIIYTIILILAIFFAIVYIVYSSNKQFRDILDKYVFRKNITNEKLASIHLDYDSNVNVIAYNKYICVLAENTLKQYNTSGNLVSELKVEISNPVYHTNDKYLVISEKNSTKTYLISDTKILWQKDIDGNIAKVDVNKNGYVALVLTGTTYKSVIATYDVKGNELFKTYLSSNSASDATISSDNKYLAWAEINTSGTFIKSRVKIVSVEKAKNEPDSSIVYTSDEVNNLITNIEYQHKDKLICIYDDSIHSISNGNDENILNLKENDKKIYWADIKLENCIYRAVEKSAGLFKANTTIEIMNTASKKQTMYTVEGAVKKMYCHKNILAIDLGGQINFINTNGWLMKSYTFSQEAQNVIIGNGIAGIIYDDRVEIINL